MSRGLVITGNCSYFNKPGEIDFSGGVDSISLRRYLTYWDRIVYADSKRFGGFNPDNFPEIKQLIDYDRFTIKLTETQFDESDDFFGKMLMSRPLAQMKIFEDLYKNDPKNFWTIGQTGNVLVLPMEKKEVPVLEVTIENCLPVPINCTIEDILELKEKRRSEFICFHHTLDEFNNKIRKSEDKKHAIISAKEKIEQSLIDLHRICDESIKDKVLSSLKTFINLGEIPIGGTIAPIIGALSSNSIEIDPKLGAMFGLAVNAAIYFSIKPTPKIDTINNELRPFAYLYHVDKLSH